MSDYFSSFELGEPMTPLAERALAALEAYESIDRDAMTDSDLLREHGLTIREALELAVKAAQYKEANPLGGPASMFRTIAERIEAGEPYHDVLQDYGVSVNVPDQERDEVTAF
jgi:hypothetical protein